jgi:signal transduction histidine kinase
MESLVDALLLLARLDDSVAPVESRDVDLDDLVLADVDRLAPAGCPVEVDVSHVSAGQVHGSPILLAQVVHNLLGNAVRHARARVAVSLREWDGRVELTVDDDGIGVPSDQRERVFERFVRLDEARARDAGGAGLGLAIVRKIVELSDGTVELGSSPLGGARFSVDLPAAH